MILEKVYRERLDKFIEAYAAKDLDAVMGFYGTDAVVEWPAGLPFAGTWKGEELRSVFRAIFDANTSMTFDIREVAVAHGLSPTGHVTGFVQTRFKAVGVDGHVVETESLNVTTTEHWQMLSDKQFFFDMPAMIEHYKNMPAITHEP